jgi:uncharacterized membrane protein YfcA
MQVAAATSGTMILMTSASAIAPFLAFGVLPLDYGVVLLVLGIVGTSAGQLIMAAAMRRLRRRSLIIIVMATLMGTAASIAVGQALLAVRAAVESGPAAMWRLHNVCDSPD